VEQDQTVPINTGPVVGVDLGVKTLATLSDGMVIPNPTPLTRRLKKIKRLHRAVSRKQKGSNNRKKAAFRLGKAYRKVSNQQANTLHQVTTRLANTKSVIVIEDLSVAGMLKHHHLAQAIADVGFAEFRRQLHYKAAWYGSQVVVVSRWEPSSTTCSGCGWYDADLDLADRVFVCQNPARPECGLVLDRDLNAAVNLSQFATLAGSSSESQNACGEESAGRSREAMVKLSSQAGTRSRRKQEPNTVSSRADETGRFWRTVPEHTCGPAHTARERALSMEPAHRVPVLIVGGGIGGLAAALALARRGLTAHVLEQATVFGEIGAGIQIAPNASSVLDRVGVLEQIASCAVYPKRMLLVDALSGETLTAVDLGAPFLRAFRYRYLVMHRNDLLTILLDACQQHEAVTLETNRHVVSVEDLGDGARATCADGSVYSCDALVGADGLHSLVRALVIGDAEPICEGFVAYRGAVPVEDVIEHGGLETIRYWIGPRLHFIQYPLRRGELYNQVAVFQSDRYRPDANAEDWGTEEELEERFAITHESVRRSLIRIKRDRHWTMYDRSPATSWTRHPITLLGDAAHPMLQYIAQGACQAIEDAECLADALACRPGDVDAAFRAYQHERIPRTARVQLTARQFGDIIHGGGDAVHRRNAVLAQRASDDYSHMDWFYAYQPQRTGKGSRVHEP
jgi:3-hydroxybenzoate 6-monooxygenase